MVFSSLFFLFFFLPANLLLYYLVPNRSLQNLILVIFSLVFYAWGEPIWVGLLVFSAFVDYLNGIFIDRFRGRPLARIGIVSTVFFNIGILMTFKYSDFIVENVNFLFGTGFEKPGFMLPIGISFYTFQTISYTIDVYRGEVPAQRSFMKFLLFVSLYHQLVAGPIVRYSHIANEIDNRIFRLRDFSSGINRFCRGLFKKVCIANIAGSISIQFLMTDKEHTTVFGEWYGLTLFALQIYFDFSGYSDMAIGLGRMFGFHYHENFKHPYIARSIADFWRRWHISLQTFFRDYVYIPLGGNRKRAVLNIFIVWSLTGLWHGASWNFVLWGLYFGLLLFIEKKLLAGFLERAPVIIRHLYALPLILFSWSLFYFTDLGDLTSFIKTAFHTTSAALYDVKLQSSIKENMYWIPFTLILCMPVYDKIFKLIERVFKSSLLTSSLTMIFNLVLFSLSVLLLVGSSYNPFLYFRF